MSLELEAKNIRASIREYEKDLDVLLKYAKRYENFAKAIKGLEAEVAKLKTGLPIGKKR